VDHGPLRMLKNNLQKVFWGWWLVLICAVITLYGAGVFHYGFSVFVHPIVSELGWSMTLVSGAFSLYRLESGIMAPLAGYLLDRIGPQKVVILGAVLMGSGYICLSQIETILPFYLSCLIISVGFGFSTGQIIGTSLISKWFIAKRGKAFGIYFSLVGLGGLLVPILSHFIILYGWRTILFYLGPITWLVVIPLAFLLKRKPEDYGLLPDGYLSDHHQASPLISSEAKPEEVSFSLQKAVSTPAYWLLAICFSIFQLTISSIFIHLVPCLITLGFEARLAALVVTCVVTTSILGRACFGWLSDFTSKKTLLMICFLMQSTAILTLVFVHKNISSIYIIFFIAAFGCSYGSIIVLRPAIAAEFYGREKFGTIWGLLQGVSIFGGIIGPVAVGFMYDLQKSYRFGLVFLCLVNVLAFFMVILLKRPGLKNDKDVPKISFPS